MNEPLPDWLQALADQMKTGRAMPTTPDYSQMRSGMTPKEFGNFLHFGSNHPGITLNQSGGEFSYRPSDVPPNAEPWFHQDFGGGPPSRTPRVPGMSSETPFNWLPGSTPDMSGQTGPGNFPSVQDQLAGQKPWTAADDARVYPMESPQQAANSPFAQAPQPNWGNLVAQGAARLAPRIAGPIGALAGMVTPTDQLAPRSMDEAPQWSWPGGR